jgi:hypothetical protein
VEERVELAAWTSFVLFPFLSSLPPSRSSRYSVIDPDLYSYSKQQKMLAQMQASGMGGLGGEGGELPDFGGEEGAEDSDDDDGPPPLEEA